MNIIHDKRRKTERKEKVQADVAADQVQYNLGDFTNPVEVIGSIARLTSDTTTPEQKQELLDNYVKHYNWEMLRITDEAGNVVGSSYYVGDKDYFITAIAGNTGITEPFYSDEVGKMVVVISAPLWKSGLIDTEIAGTVFAAVDARIFADLVAGIKVSEGGAAYVIDSSGNTIAHSDFSLVESFSNTIKDAETDSSLKQLAKLEQKMIDGQIGYGKYSYGGVTKYMTYAPIGVNGWSVAITAPTSDFNRSAIWGVVVIVVMLMITLASATAVANKYGKQIGDAVSVCAERIKLLAEGATEQTLSVDELLRTVSVVTDQVEINNKAADEAHIKIVQLGEEADMSGKKMEELTMEMKNIEDTSTQISEIIADIESIASQTNLLSLNASIEVARAGEAGRGFAVVADQIGKLAEQSAQSAVNTRRLIETSIQEIAKGSQVTAQTAEHMKNMMEGLNAMVSVIEKVSEASNSQAKAIGEIKSEVDQINSVVQNNSAAAEESSATSEELSAQAQSMEDLVARFQLPE